MTNNIIVLADRRPTAHEVAAMAHPLALALPPHRAKVVAKAAANLFAECLRADPSEADDAESLLDACVKIAINETNGGLCQPQQATP